MEQIQKLLNMDFNLQWTLLKPDFSKLTAISFTDVIDMLLVAYIIYRLMKLFKDTSANRLVKGIIILAAALLLTTSMHLTTIAFILRIAFTYAPFVLVLLFQPELRRLLEQLGKGNLSRLFLTANDPDAVEAAISATVAACADMAETRTGVLIVFERRERLGEIIATGTIVDAAPSPELLKNIFFKNSPLHDGATIVRDGRIHAAGCVLPLSGNQSLSRDLGTRHRAAVGMSEGADSVLVVVSEETGSISVAIGGMLKRRLTPDVLRKVLESELLESDKPDRKRLAGLRSLWKGAQGK